MGLFVLSVLTAFASPATSPNGHVTLKQEGKGFQVYYHDLPVLTISEVGLCSEASGSLTLVSGSQPRRVPVDYTMLSGKRSHCTNVFNEYRYEYRDEAQRKQVLVMRLCNDGIAFRYEAAGLTGKTPQEKTTFRVAEGTPRWMMTWSDGYEGFYPLSKSGKGAEGQKGNRWAFPTLLQPAEDCYVLLSEAGIERNHAASSLMAETADSYTDYHLFTDKNDQTTGNQWTTPWRIAIIGSMADVVASTLVTDMAEPCRLKETDWIQPGVVSWVYWAYNHGSNDYSIIKKYVDAAVDLHLPYVLIDAEWDEMKDGKTIEDAVAYAREKGIRPLIWYNSSVGWINGAPGPKFRLNKPEDREKEFAWCERIGVAGVKIDFFSGDSQMNMAYCIDLLESAARHHLTVNFHGATIPRGWQRTYPNLLSTEGVYGAEWYNNVATFTTRAARHNCTLPFTRNVIGPMDYTPCAFSDSQHPHITTHAHELALTVVYESALQHLADRPESLLAQPEAVRRFFGSLPTAWDDTRLVAGYPGEYVIMARRSGKTWYVGMLNGSDEERTVKADWSFLDKDYEAQCFADSGDSSDPWLITTTRQLPTEIKLLPRGGRVYVIKGKMKK